MSGSTLAISDSWYLPQPDEITEPYYQAYETNFVGSNPRDPNSVMGVTARTHGIVGFGLYLYQRSLADELMVDTARVWLPRHADQWAVPQIPASYAVGNLIFAGNAGDTLPSAIEVVSNDGLGTQWITLTGATYGSDNTATVPCKAEMPGTAGNLAAGQSVTIISPIQGLQNGTATVAAGGLAGGTPVEGIEAWRARIEQRIRQRGRAGSASDYVDWAEANGAASDGGGVNVVPGWVGGGSLAVIFALPNPAGPDRLIPNPSQVTVMQAALDLVRPVTAQVIALAAVRRGVTPTLSLSVDTVVNRGIATTVSQSYIAANAIGGLLDRSKLIDAIIQATGSGVEMPSPAGNVQAAPTEQLALDAPLIFVGYT